MAEVRNVYRILVGKPERKSPLWKDNIKIDLREAG
jgi:hypothetical protein